MKLLIASDIHGSAKWAGQLLRVYEAEKPEKLVLLGDFLYHGPRNDLPDDYAPKTVIPQLNALREKILAVRGNCDAEVDQMVLAFPMMADYTMLYVDGTPIYATHGHIYGPDNPPPMEAGAVLLSGHTHIGGEASKEGFVFINPGSVSLPKDGHHSYILYEDGVFERRDFLGQALGRWAVQQK